MKDFVLDIMGQIFEVQHIDNLKEEEDAWGLIEEENFIIKIDSSLEGVSYFSTLIHEVGHAICVRGGGRQALDSQAEEILVDQFGTVLTENFKIELL